MYNKIEMFKNRIAEDAREEGLKEGKEAGKEAGLKEGMEKGLKKGIEKGVKEGMERGVKEGKKEGVMKERLSNALAMLQNKLDVALVAKCTNLSIGEVEKLQKTLA